MSGRSDIERCGFCKKSRKLVDRLIEGPSNNYICDECIELCHSLIHEEKRGSIGLALEDVPPPKTIKAFLDNYVIGQEHAKKVLAVAVYGHYRRMMARQSPGRVPEGVEIEKSNKIGRASCRERV